MGISPDTCMAVGVHGKLASCNSEPEVRIGSPKSIGSYTFGKQSDISSHRISLLTSLLLSRGNRGNASWDPYQASKLQGSASEAFHLSLARPHPHDLLSSLPSVPGLIVFSGIPVGYAWSLLLAHTVTQVQKRI